MTRKTPLLMQATGGDAGLSYSALDVRGLGSALFYSEGIVGGPGSMKVSQRAAGANFTVDIAAGQCVVQGDDVTDQGMYLCTSTAVESVTIPTPPVSGTRTHRVIARVRDKAHKPLSWSTYDWIFECLEDTSGVTPSEPDSAITVAFVTVPSGAANVTDAMVASARVHAQSWPGRVLQVASAATRPAVPLPSETIWRTDKKFFETWDGTAWRVHGGVIHAIKAADTTPPINNSTSFVNDPDLQCTIVSGVIYDALIELVYSTYSSADIKFQLYGPAGATFDGRCSALPASSTGNTGDDNYKRYTLNDSRACGGAGAETTTYMTATISGTLTGGDGGLFGVQLAQETAQLQNTYLRGKSKITLTPRA